MLVSVCYLFRPRCGNCHVRSGWGSSFLSAAARATLAASASVLAQDSIVGSTGAGFIQWHEAPCYFSLATTNPSLHVLLKFPLRAFMPFRLQALLACLPLQRKQKWNKCGMLMQRPSMVHFGSSNRMLHGWTTSWIEPRDMFPS